MSLKAAIEPQRREEREGFQCVVQSILLIRRVSVWRRAIHLFLATFGSLRFELPNLG